MPEPQEARRCDACQSCMQMSNCSLFLQACSILVDMKQSLQEQSSSTCPLPGTKEGAVDKVGHKHTSCSTTIYQGRTLKKESQRLVVIMLGYRASKTYLLVRCCNMVVWGSHFRSLAGTLALLWSAAPTILCRLSSMEKVSIWFTAFRRTQGCPAHPVQPLIKA